jgi:uncharacterized protein with LGFP repeats
VPQAGLQDGFLLFDDKLLAGWTQGDSVWHQVISGSGIASVIGYSPADQGRLSIKLRL